jgi:hypothetical protein
MLAEGKETYTEFALKHYDWERIEKTKGQIIENQVDYISDVFDTVTFPRTRLEVNGLLFFKRRS